VAENNIVRIPGVFRFFETGHDNLKKVLGLLEGAPFFLTSVTGTEASLLVPGERFEACRELATDSHEHPFSVLRIVARFVPTSRGLLARAATLLADNGMQILAFTGAAGIYFAVMESQAEKAIQVLKTLWGPLPGSGEWKA
jgi:hypothetical protein